MKTIITLMFSALVFNTQATELIHEMGTTKFKTTPKKVVALDWALSETVLSLGVELDGIADAEGYNQWVVEPKLNPDAVNVGSRREPNLELLTKLQPDVILISKHMAAAYEPLKKIAPVVVFSLYSEQKQPLESAKSVTLSLGKLLGRETQAQEIILQTETRLSNNGDKIRAAGNADKPLLLTRFINDKTLRIHGEGALADATIRSMGLKNDWSGQTNLWGFSTSGIERVAEHQTANVMIFGPLTDAERQQLTGSPLWQAMAFTRTNSVYELPAIWTFGGLVAAQRFSDHITQQLTSHP